jgi:hypothetical protein
VYKKGDKHAAENYRPVSLTSVDKLWYGFIYVPMAVDLSTVKTNLNCWVNISSFSLLSLTSFSLLFSGETPMLSFFLDFMYFHIDEPIPKFIIRENGVEKLLQDINPSKASGPDGIPNRILKECASQIAPSLTVTNVVVFPGFYVFPERLGFSPFSMVSFIKYICPFSFPDLLLDFFLEVFIVVPFISSLDLFV